MRTSEVLNKAADLIEKRGWVRGSGWPMPGRSDERLCLEGGIMAALGEHMGQVDLNAFWDCPAYRAVMSYLGRDETRVARSTFCPTPVVAEPLWCWNDDQPRGDEGMGHVLATLRAAAVIEAAKETADERETVGA